MNVWEALVLCVGIIVAGAVLVAMIAPGIFVRQPPTIVYNDTRKEKLPYRPTLDSKSPMWYSEKVTKTTTTYPRRKDRTSDAPDTTSLHAAASGTAPDSGSDCGDGGSGDSGSGDGGGCASD